MPPCLDVYIATERSRATVDKFLAYYADLSAELLRNDYEVWLWNTEEYVSTGTLKDTVAYGLSNNDISFTLYLSGKAISCNRVMLHFGMPGQLVVGMSVEESIAETPNDAAAEQLLATLKTEFATQKGIIGLELPPIDAAEELANN